MFLFPKSSRFKVWVPLHASTSLPRDAFPPPWSNLLESTGFMARDCYNRLACRLPEAILNTEY